MHLCKVFGALFCVRARCSPKFSDGVLLVKTGSVINAVWPPSSESVIKIKSCKKRRRVNVVCCPDHDLTDDELLVCGYKCDMILIKFDHVTPIVVVNVVFTRLIVGGDTQVVEVLRSICHNQLVESFAVINFAVGMEFLYEGERWMIEKISSGSMTASNLYNNIVCLYKNEKTCLWFNCYLSYLLYHN